MAVHTRKNVTALSRSERRRLVEALLALKRRGEYDEFVRTHIEHYVSDGEGGLRTAHMTPSFLPWHRQFLLELERALQRVDASVTVPYWDWTRARSASAAPWTEDLLGGNGRRSDGRVTTGPFAYAGGAWPIKESVTDAEYLMRDLGRHQDPIGLPTRAELDRALTEPLYAFTAGSAGTCSAAPPSTIPSSGCTTPSSTCSGRGGSSGTGERAICPRGSRGAGTRSTDGSWPARSGCRRGT
jgi:tyrosinase